MTPTTPATPGTGTAQTPRRDAIRHNVIQIFKQWRDGHIYDSDVEGFLFGAFEDCSLIERDLTTAQHQLQEAREIITRLMFAAENADETGYVTDVGFINLDELHALARSFLTTSAPKEKQTHE